MAQAASEAGLIAQHYQLVAGRAPILLLGGLRGLLATDRRASGQDYLAVCTQPDLPPRPHMLGPAAAPDPIPHVVLPVAQGSGVDLAGVSGWYVVSPALPGPALAAERHAWREAELITRVLLPVAAALEAMRQRGLTHRAICPDNLYRAGPGEPVVLGPCWTAPPACFQPTVCEPVYSAQALPYGRGDGVIADDVYALGVTLLALALGRLPLRGLDDAAVIRKKLELGSYAALTGGVQLPPVLNDLLPGMLAEDPDHRLTPTMLLDPDAARGRRLASRPPRRSQRPLDIGGIQVRCARELAYAMAIKPEPAAPMLIGGAVERWLRRGVMDPTLAGRLEETLRERAADPEPESARARAAMVMRAIAVLDPLAPLCWRGVALWPEGLGPLLVAPHPELAGVLDELIRHEVAAIWAGSRNGHGDLAGIRREGRDWRQLLTLPGPTGGLRRLAYQLNPGLCCLSPMVAAGTVAKPSDLLAALESAAPTADRKRLPLDAPMLAFLAARGDGALLTDIGRVAGLTSAEDHEAILRLFARLQLRLAAPPLPGLATWLVEAGLVPAEIWRNRLTRKQLAARVEEQARAGRIAGIAALLDDPAALEADERGARAAAARLVEIAETTARLEKEEAGRQHFADHIGQEIAAAAGLAASLGSAFMLAMS